LKKRGLMEILFGKNAKNGKEDFTNLDREKKEMIRGILELSNTVVREIMVPRIDVDSISVDMPPDELLKKISDCRHSRVPVYAKTIDNVIGILHIKDLLKYLIHEKEAIDIRKIMRKAYFVPESKKLNSLLKDFKRLKAHIAIVIDEYGGTSGIVCLEDVIEEIVGDIQDEFDNETEEILKLDDGVYLCDARTNLEELNEILKVSLPLDDYDTLGGFVFDLFGKIPAKYEKVSYQNNDFIIHDMDGNIIRSIKIVRKKKAEDDDQKKTQQ
jgi:magnesium and cobalt transporter